MSDHEQIQQRAAELLLRREEPDWSEADQAALEAWLDQSMAHRAAFWRLEHSWQQADRLRSLHDPFGEPPRPRSAARRWTVLALAASMVMAVVLASFALWPGWKPVGTQYATRMGQRGTLTLADGSWIELNTDSRIRTVFEPHQRQIWLDRGEAYFDVTHDAQRPFTVHSGLRDVSVLGTKFTIRRDPNKLMVAVVDGKVRVGAAGRAVGVPSVSITRGNIAIAQGSSTLIIANAETRIENDLAWRNGMLVFDGAKLADAAAEFNRYSHQKLEIADDGTDRIVIGGAFQGGNALGFARLLGTAYRLKVRISPDRIKVSQP